MAPRFQPDRRAAPPKSRTRTVAADNVLFQPFRDVDEDEMSYVAAMKSASRTLLAVALVVGTACGASYGCSSNSTPIPASGSNDAGTDATKIDANTGGGGAGGGGFAEDANTGDDAGEDADIVDANMRPSVDGNRPQDANEFNQEDANGEADAGEDANAPVDAGKLDASSDAKIADANGADSPPCYDAATKLYPGSTDAGGLTLYCPFGSTGNKDCNPASAHCCEPATGSSSCTALDASCPVGDVDWHCGDPATDCPGTAPLCCGNGTVVAATNTCPGAYSLDLTSTGCAAACAQNQIQICETNAECPIAHPTCLPFRSDGNDIGYCN
jgi:hypothetical protein